MKGITNHHIAQEEHVSLPDWFIRRALGDPKRGPVAEVNARTSAEVLEESRKEHDARELLQRALTYVKDSRQGRGDKILQADIEAFLRAPEVIK